MVLEAAVLGFGLSSAQVHATPQDSRLTACSDVYDGEGVR